MLSRLQLVRDQNKEKPLELEMGWLCAESEWKHQLVPKDLVLEADKVAIASVEGLAPAEPAAEGGFTGIEGAGEEKVMDVEI